MTKDDLYSLLLARHQLEFKYNGKNYCLILDSEIPGKNFYTLGRVYDIPQKFDSWGQMMNEARIENHFFREMIPSLDFI